MAIFTQRQTCLLYLGDIWCWKLLGSKCLPIESFEPGVRLDLLGCCLSASETEDGAGGEQAVDEALERLRKKQGGKGNSEGNE